MYSSCIARTFGCVGFSNGKRIHGASGFTRLLPSARECRDLVHARMRAASFTDAEILDLTVCIGGWLALGRTLHVLGLDDACKLTL